MRSLRGWIVMSWIMLPGVMFGGGLLLRRLTGRDPDPFGRRGYEPFTDTAVC
jgi:hypothetical protein